ncbi:Pkinase-domain-containing protein [Amylocystis lapponica]|nr:Pkinase-domain-containing protein [Amylocystis lapponica]
MNVPPSPAVNTKSCADRLTIEEDDGVEVTTLRPEDHPWSGFIDENAAEGTGTARPRRQVSARPVPTPNIPTTYGSPGSSNWTGTTLVEPGRPDDDSDSDEGTIWAKAPKRAGESLEESFKNYISPEKTRTSRPPLPPLSIEGSSAPNATILPSSVVFPDPKAPPADFPGPPTFIPPMPPPLRPTRRPSTKSGGSRQRQDQRTSRFDDNFDYTWAPRPPPEDVYERLEEYFPEHDLDRPVIETPSGGTSPTATESPTPHRFRHKKSIRVVAAEHKRRIDRTSHADASSVSVALRKRNTKLWGSKLEEVTAGQPNTGALSVTDPSPGGALKPIFRWVRGELIGKGTYGKVYLALNATTGEMIAVKQVEIPRTASDKSDTRQVSVVEALKLESETLKDLDHPNIVQYLGFEETPTFLSIFLEYVPGGSIGSCLRKHGKFDEEVTKSFTEQILAGLEYLHSRGILHRDMKADNILVETSGICKISDFGISKRTEDIEMAGAYTSMQGTVFWMAPEVINSSKQGYNSKIDIWSVGCVVFEMWTGQRPWNGQEAMAVLLHLYQTKEGPSLPADVVLSPLADDFRQKCFAMDPDERPSAAELRRHPYLELQPGWQFNGFK